MKLSSITISNATSTAGIATRTEGAKTMSNSLLRGLAIFATSLCLFSPVANAQHRFDPAQTPDMPSVQGQRVERESSGDGAESRVPRATHNQCLNSAQETCEHVGSFTHNPKTGECSFTCQPPEESRIPEESRTQSQITR
ncbi:MAG: hypothetical protein AAFV90_01825 [Cyanobacteria bacterium J06634_5]